jgi:hypothetical protein
VDLDGKMAVVATPPPGVPAASALAAAISAALGSPVPLPLQSLLAADAAQLPAIAAELAPGGLNGGNGKYVLRVRTSLLHELQTSSRQAAVKRTPTRCCSECSVCHQADSHHELTS